MTNAEQNTTPNNPRTERRNLSERAKRPFLLVTYAILLYLGLQHFSYIRSVCAWVFTILQPVAYGICFSFITNLFLKFFRTKVFRAMSESPKAWERKLCPVLCVGCTVLLVLCLLLFVILIIIPQLITALNTLIEKMPRGQEQFLALAESKLLEWNAPQFLIDEVNNFSIDWKSVLSFLQDVVLKGKAFSFLGSAFSATASVISGATNLVLGLIISVYLTAQKNRVLFIMRKMIQLFVPERYRAGTHRILRLTNISFANFLTAQFLEAVIIGTLCSIGLALLQFPYAATIGVLTGITALLPIIGAWIGGGVGALLIWVAAPQKTVWFLVFILVLQQLEGQFIYPKVVGDRIGLPGILVLIAVVLGGGFGGILGILFTVPLFAILYALLKDAIEHLPEEETEAPAAPPAPESPAPEETPVSSGS